jgi:GNAT superfamily N-acetyltransferase
MGTAEPVEVVDPGQPPVNQEKAIMKITTLKEHPEYIPTLAKWHYDQWAYLNPGGTLEGRIRFLAAQMDSDNIPKTFVAIAGDTLLGSASLVPHDMETRMELTPWLASVYVATEQRKQGIGSALVRHVVQEAGRRGYQTLYLFTPDQQALYAGLGWTTLEVDEYRGHEVDIMTIDTASCE